MYLLYSTFGFTGIYVFVLIMSSLISVSLFNNLIKHKNGLLLSFIMTIIAVLLSKIVFAARNQIFSFLIFELEVYCLHGLLEDGKKRYFWFLIVLEFLLVLVHDTLYILFFVFIMPYLVDIILNKFFKIDDTFKFKNSNLQNAKYLIILIVLGIPIGFCTPVFASTYTNLINCMGGISASYINELLPINMLEELSLLTFVFLAIGLFGFTKTKFKIKDVLFVFGLLIFAMIARRNLFFFLLIGLIYLTNMLTECINTYIGEKNKEIYYELFEKSKYLITFIFCFTTIFSIKNIFFESIKDYVSDIAYPVKATKWIKENVDCDNMRLWTNFNWGSYLELEGIKVFIDSRSGMYTEEENEGCTVFSDWISVRDHGDEYEEIFEKYDITHILAENSYDVKKYLTTDDNYQIIYEDSSFTLFERIAH